MESFEMVKFALASLVACTDADNTDSKAEDTPSTMEAPKETTDVLVIGSGGAGMSAGYAATQAGRSAIVLERGPAVGGASWWAGRYWAAGTKYQAERGIGDSVELALSEWSATTFGGDPTDPNVIAFVERSAATMEFIIDDLGVELRDVGTDPGIPGAARIHDLPADLDGPIARLNDRIGDSVRVNTEATELVFDDSGAVIGAWIRDTGTEEVAWIQSRATVVASGGFAANLDMVLEDRPELAGMTLVIETYETAIGTGRPLLEDVGVWQGEGRSGVYFHSLPDPREDYPDQMLHLGGLPLTLMVDTQGNRIANEEEYNTFNLVSRVLELPDRRLYALYTIADWEIVTATAPNYNDGASFDAFSLEDMGLAQRFASAEAAATGLGLDAATFGATVARYEELVTLGEDQDYGKPSFNLHSFGDEGMVAVELVAGSAKSFGGFTVDVDGRILNAAGQAVPGLYAAGEAVGMMGSPSIGSGLSGAVTVVYASGLATGEAAAADMGD